MAGVARTLGAVAAGAAAALVDHHQAGGQNRAAGDQLFEAGLELTADEGGMFRDFAED